MAIEVHEVDLAADSRCNVMRVMVSGKLTTEDYKRFVPEESPFPFPNPEP